MQTYRRSSLCFLNVLVLEQVQPIISYSFMTTDVNYLTRMPIYEVKRCGRAKQKKIKFSNGFGSSTLNLACEHIIAGSLSD